jgi:hypothetical protein
MSSKQTIYHDYSVPLASILRGPVGVVDDYPPAAHIRSTS